ncbi:hypothetical protein CYMTET_56880 [Cymbomonas tetramitiformis]|uniref:Uncharacterized protein n=1 Tax=Cymbomonas tetramitiformis TaxID=36881 RepID=A0AAE0BBB3_9CHLO|nr:hypothetical protein CYMTET_56880 [Cymbomonas tetramitiformis]
MDDDDAVQERKSCGGVLPSTLINYAIKTLGKALHQVGCKNALEAKPEIISKHAQQVIAQVQEAVMLRANEVQDDGSKLSVRACFHSDSTSIIRGIKKDPQLAAAIMTGGASADEVLRRCREVLQQFDRSSNVIRHHHYKMRKTSNGTESSAAQVWEETTGDRVQLEAYAAAAHMTGEQQWVRQGNDWCVERALEWLRHGGAQRAQLKEFRRRHYSEHGKAPDAEAEAALEQQLTPAGDGGRGDPLRTLDVGSCFNPFRRYPELEVTALDLCPADPSVFQCDFLQLQVGEAGTGIVAGPHEADELRGAASAGKLLSLEQASFDVITMSLVLSYIPHPLMRTQMVAKARALLKEPGMLCLVTPHSTDRAKGSEPASQLNEWQRAIEAVGFKQYRRSRLHSTHALAFSTQPAGPPLPPCRPKYLPTTKPSLGATTLLSSCPEAWSQQSLSTHTTRPAFQRVVQAQGTQND